MYEPRGHASMSGAILQPPTRPGRRLGRPLHRGQRLPADVRPRHDRRRHGARRDRHGRGRPSRSPPSGSTPRPGSSWSTGRRRGRAAPRAVTHPQRAVVRASPWTGRSRSRASARSATTSPSAATSTRSSSSTGSGCRSTAREKDAILDAGLAIMDAINEQTGRSTRRTPRSPACHHVYLAAPGSTRAAHPPRDGDPPRLVRPVPLRHRARQRPDGPAARARRARRSDRTSSTSRSSARPSSAGWSRRPPSAGSRPSCRRITGRAWITGTAQYMLDPDDPFPAGFLL